MTASSVELWSILIWTGKGLTHEDLVGGHSRFPADQLQFFGTVGTGVILGGILPGRIIPASIYNLVVRPILTAQCHHLDEAFDIFTIFERPYVLPSSIEYVDHHHNSALRPDRAKRKCRGSLRFCNSR